LVVVVVDEHLMVAQSIAGVLSEVAGLDVAGVCVSVDEAMVSIRCTLPELLVLDARLGGDAHRLAASLLQRLNPSGRVMFMTDSLEPFEVPPDLRPVTIGVFSKKQGWEVLLDALQSWLLLHPAHSDSVSTPCIDRLNSIGLLSPREHTLLLELGSGHHNKQIAARLMLSDATVDTYRKHVAAKLGVSGSELIRLATLYRCLRWQRLPLVPNPH
jgi:DNA-binding NarL/FixJ family response regulator